MSAVNYNPNIEVIAALKEKIKLLEDNQRTGLGTENLLLLTDGYKVSHHVQYPKKTQIIYSYFESRGGLHKEVCFFGLQIFLQKYLKGVVVTQEKIDEAATFYDSYFGPGTNVFNKKGWEYILKEHSGLLPVRIKALPEGTCLPYKNAMFTMENTDPKCFWLTNFLETLLVQVWYPMTVATNSREQKKIILKSLMETGDPAGIDFKLHDFGFRGVSSVESAGNGGAAHLTQFSGTDTVAGLVVARDYYGAECAGFSIPASEHSTMTAWGKEGEFAAYKNMLKQYQKGLVACVSDSYDIYHAAGEIWGKQLKELVLQRDGQLVIRPDSGYPPAVDLKLLEILGKSFGYTINEKGFKVLHPKVRIIQGDGIDIDMIDKILKHINSHGWSTDNIAFGSGGGLLQKLNRDTQKCAFKCSSATIDDKEIAVFKNPVTDPGKTSKKGRLTVNRLGGSWVTKCGKDVDPETDQLRTVFENGYTIYETSWDTIKKRAAVTEDMIKPGKWKKVTYDTFPDERKLSSRYPCFVYTP
jgi:nicotinamide phosphoribosyltransferase